MTDCDFLAQVLADGEWHSHNDILESSFYQRGYGLTVHSRASDLRKKRGMNIETKLRSTDGRTVSFYRLVLEETSASPKVVRDDIDGLTGVSSSTSPDRHGVTLSAVPACEPSSSGGVLELFACDVDESGGMRGTYWEPDAA